MCVRARRSRIPWRGGPLETLTFYLLRIFPRSPTILTGATFSGSFVVITREVSRSLNAPTTRVCVCMCVHGD